MKLHTLLHRNSLSSNRLLDVGDFSPHRILKANDCEATSCLRLKTPLDHVNLFAWRRNGFSCLYDIKFDQQRLRFIASLKMGDGVSWGVAKSKRAAKQEAALSFLQFLCSNGVQANWGLAEDAAECEAYL
ncbi:Ribosome biogenesis protein BOP1 [Trichuris trichiura]|uniref:Ribosome biogenesis protein BOP1 n=1 Tax=Trichuris trichiura TaxID=36087 RepID=A0A077ZHS9_TRITR|nr:Ribosome biogenesis protein BOP1 [Trichuris trichiura]